MVWRKYSELNIDCVFKMYGKLLNTPSSWDPKQELCIKTQNAKNIDYEMS
jgi:hypothetical protein